MHPTADTRHSKIQWHITERCNWRCKHCYQNDDCSDELDTDQLFSILDKYITFLKVMNIPKERAKIHITGGEPFVRDDFMHLVRKMGSLSNHFRWGLLSNGSYLDRKNIEELKRNGLHSYQVSLEGLEEHNDSIRGEGSFKKTINALKIISDCGIWPVVSLTLTKDNIKDIPKMVPFLDGLGVRGFGVRRLIPEGRGAQLKESLLEPDELKAFYLKIAQIEKCLRKKGSKLHIRIGCESGIFNEDNINQKQYCGIHAESGIFTVMPNGDVYNCRRLPIKIGNITESSFQSIMNDSKKSWDIKNLNNVHPFCSKCSNFMQCFGGAKCVTYAYTGKLSIPDIQCWRYFKKIEPKEYFDNFKEMIADNLELSPSIKRWHEHNVNSGQQPHGINLTQDRNNFKTTDRVKLKISNKCNNNCIFCDSLDMKADRELPFNEINELMMTLMLQGTKSIKLPCNAECRRDFIEILRYARQLGFRLTLETNGRMLSVKKFFDMVNPLIDEYILLDFGNQNSEKLTGVKYSSAQQENIIRNISHSGKMLRKLNCDLKIKNISEDFSKPSEVIINVTARCNFNCRLCFNRNSFAKAGRDSDAMSTEYIKEIIDSISQAGVEIVRFSGGEPLMRDDIFTLMQYAKEKGLRVWLNTNASLITEENSYLIEEYVENILIPMNGYNSETDTQWTCTKDSFSSKIRGLQLLLARDIPMLRVGTALTPDNIDNLENINNLISELGISYWIAYRPIMKDTSPEKFDIKSAVNKLIRIGIARNMTVPIVNSIPFCAYDHKLMDMICNGALYDDGHARLIVDPRGFAKPSYFINENIGDPRDIMSCWNHDFMKRMRGLELVPEECRICTYLSRCKGGSRYAAILNNDSFSAKDPLMTQPIEKEHS